MAIVTRASYLQEQNMHGIECKKEACPNQAIYLTDTPLMLIVAGELWRYGKTGWDKLIRVDYHGSKEVPKGTCHAILKAAGIKKK